MNFFMLSGQGVTPATFSPLFWHDFSDRASYSYLTADNLDGSIVDAATAKTGQAIVSYDGTVAKKPAYNGEGYYFDGGDGMKTGTVSTFNSLHDGTDFTIYFVYKQLTVSNTHNGVLFGNSDSGPTSRGLIAVFDNRAASSRTNALSFVISNGSIRLINFVAQNAITQNAYNVIKLKKVGLNFSAFVNGVQVGSTTAIIDSFSASDAANIFAIGSLPTSLSAATNCYKKQLVIFNRQLSASEETAMDSWAAAQALNTITPTAANVYIMGISQSNGSGRGPNGQIDPVLNGGVGAKVWYNSNSTWEQLTLNRNQTQESPLVQHGAEMRFGYAMNNLNANCYIIKYAGGGMPVAQDGANQDWNVATVGEGYDIMKSFLLNATSKFEHVLRKTPVFRGFISIHGESDSQNTWGASYKTNFTATFNGLVDYINTTLGYSTSKMRLYISRVRSGITFSGFDSAQHTLVRAAQDDIGSNYLTDNPTYTTKVKGTTSVSSDDLPLQGDNLHFTTAGFDTLGTRIYDYFSQYVNE